MACLGSVQREVAVAASGARAPILKDTTDYVNDAVAAIEALGQLWSSVSNDSLAIEQWLKQGARDAVRACTMRTCTRLMMLCRTCPST